MIFAFGLPLLCSLLIAVSTVVYLVDTLLISQVQEKVAADLRSAREIYNTRLEHLRQFVKFGANLPGLAKAIKDSDSDTMIAMLQSLRVREGEDILTLVDSKGNVVARARNPEASGDNVSTLSPVRAALLGESAASTEILGPEVLGLEGIDLKEQATFNLLPTPRARPNDATKMENGMVLFAAEPILDEQGRVAGVLYAADLLNRDYEMVDKIRATVFGNEKFDGRSIGTATLFLGDVRVSTNVPADTGKRAVGTRVSAEVADRVLTGGLRWIDRAFVVNDWYISAYEPLYNLKEEVVGILYVGILERPYSQLVWKSVAVVAALNAAGIVLGLLLLLTTLYRWVAKPLRTLREGARKIEAGDLGHHIPTSGDDELAQLAQDFNAMTEALRARDVEIDELTSSLEEKVKERSLTLETRNEELLQARSEVLEMMDKQKNTNKELQNSLERLRATQEELVRSGKLAALGSMAAGVAHEINNPLATIQGNVEILKLQLVDHPETNDEINRIAQQTKRLQTIVSNLLTFARAEKVVPEPTDIAEVARQIVLNVSTQARASGVEIQSTLLRDMPMAATNESRIAQVFVNIALNAIQAMEGGGVLTITSGVDPDRGEVFVSFSDTGKGIRPEDREKIWNPFFTTRASGTGLGLSISHAIVEEYHGRINLHSQEGEGTLFTVCLPMST
jgi:two-component system NtrC family sensor kinase